MRHMRPQDLPRIEQLAREQNERDGTSYPVPPIFDYDADGRAVPALNAPLALVTERDGVVEQGSVFIRTLELMVFGTEPRATVASVRNNPSVFYLLREKGYEDLHVFIPQTRAAAMQNRLALGMGLKRDDARLAHFYRTLKAED